MEKIRAIVVGCGDRGCIYAEEGAIRLGQMEIVAAVDPDPVRRKYMHEHFGVPEEMCFARQEELLAMGRIADCVINGTMDQYHLATAIPFLEAGYDMLLEKPVANNERDLFAIRDAADRHGRKLMVCHVLRFTPFYKKIKELLLEGTIGEIVCMETSESVGFYHSSVSFLRGKWKSERECGSSLLLQKCCHDMDLLCWLNNGTIPAAVDSFGSRDYFVPEKAPKGAGTRCLVDCPEEIRRNCVYDAKAMYLDQNLMPWYPWQCTGKDYHDLTQEEKRESLLTDNPHGVCVYKTGGDIVDHQTVNVRFANGSTAVHTLILGCAKPGRHIRIVGTKGELEGSPDDEVLELRRCVRDTAGFDVSPVDFGGDQGGCHFGGDRGLVADFCSLLRGAEPSVSCTSIDDSVNGHRLVYRAEESRRSGRTVAF